MTKKSRVKRNCECCNKEFEILPYLIKAGYGKFCSRDCYAESMRGKQKPTKVERIKVTCLQCNKTFLAYPCDRDRKFCSKECSDESHRIRLIHECENCGKTFNIIPSQLSRGWGKYCSRSCWKLDIHQKAESALVKKTCSYCGNTFIAHNHNNDSKYCSNKCSALGTIDHRSDWIGTNNPNWKGGITPENERIRTSAEYKIFRDTVYERDSYTCQKCNETGSNLECHHQYNFAEFPTLRLDPSNGVTFCEDCHDDFHCMFGRKHNNPNQVVKFLIM